MGVATIASQCPLVMFNGYDEPDKPVVICIYVPSSLPRCIFCQPLQESRVSLVQIDYINRQFN